MSNEDEEGAERALIFQDQDDEEELIEVEQLNDEEEENVVFEEEQNIDREEGEGGDDVSGMPSIFGVQQQQQQSGESGDYELSVIANVAGRLRLLNDAHRYAVTVGELRRRISPPESLNVSVVGAILRRAKTKEGSKELSDELTRYGITVPRGRRKAAPNTAFTCLIEEEARTLANDLNAIYESEWSAAEFAKEKTRRALGAGADPRILHHRALISAKTMEDLIVFFETCQHEYEFDQENIFPAHRHYARMTHEFGWRAHCAMLEAQRRMLLEEARIYAALIPGRPVRAHAGEGGSQIMMTPPD